MTKSVASVSRLQRFSHLQLASWRNFVQVSVPLEERVFLIGPNASGKSNFLDAFRFLHDLVALGGGFGKAIAKRGGVSKLRCLSARRYSDIEIRVSVSGSEQDPLWQYQISFSQDKLRRPVLKRERVYRGRKLILDRPDIDDKTDPARLHQTYLEQVNVNREFRDLADFFRSINYLHLVPQLIRDTERQTGLRNDPFGSDFLEQIARTSERTRNSRLRRINKALEVAVPQLQELEFFRDQVTGTPHLRGRYKHWRPSGAWQTEDQFSDGTLRLLGLLWAVLDSPGPLLLEEPELSLHPEVVCQLPPMFSRMQRRASRQVLLSSHSSDLLRDDGIGLDEVLLLKPQSEGTQVTLATSLAQAKILMDQGVPLAEVLLPETRPPRPEQLALFEA